MPSEKALDRAAWQAARAFRTDYARRLDEGPDVAGSYQATYRKSRRTICSWIEAARYNWIAAGMPAHGPTFPPLDRPAEMFGWWVGAMKNSPPAILSELASGRGVTPPRVDSSASSNEGHGEEAHGGSPAAAPAQAPRLAASAGAVGAPPVDHAAPPVPMSLEAAYTAQTHYVAAACRRYDDAAARRNPPATSVELKTLADERNRAIETLRKVKADLDSAAVEQGRLVSLPQLRGELAPMLEAIQSAFFRTLRDVAGLDPARARVAADGCFSELRASRFAQAAPTHAPPLAA